ncbi:MAG: 23S rRNA (guanosine(2251)-2'-O)-methyltransferase RlmB [Candidatus Schekmanbacteria bacterium]|nr:MAG: 23S rRNA (guanosine(2251)-2'-O)-methyltransferase RlmB [Candidatus Schekmanbacteria bacterium]
MVRKGQHGRKPDRAALKKKEIIYGLNPVKESIRAGKRKIFSIYLLKRRSDFFHNIIEEAERKNIRIIFSDEREIEKMASSSTHQGIAAEISPYPYLSIDDFLKEVSDKEDSFVLFLDGITDPMNFGSIIRSALLFGVDYIVTEERNCAPVTATVCKASAGAVEHMKIVVVTNLVKLAERLKDIGFWIYGADAEASHSIREMDFPKKKVIVLGSEGKGIRRLLKTVCDDLFFIPTTRVIDSLNVSAAASVILSHLYSFKK